MNFESLLKLLGPVCVVVATLSILRHGSERSWVLPPPMMIWLVFGAQRGVIVPWVSLLLAQAAAFLLIVACWKQRRALARWAVVGGGVAVVWMLLGSTPAPG